MQALQNMVISADVLTVLERLQTNLKTHQVIVEEAQRGFKVALETELKQKLADLQEGKEVSMSFKVNYPKDHIGAYRTIITMLELATEKTVLLTAEQVRHFYNDDWDWKRGFLAANSHYSVSAQTEYDNY